MEQTQPSCPKCHAPIEYNDYFCKSCGVKLKDKPLSTSFFTQLKIYLFSALLPPLGLIPAIKYLHQTDSPSKKIGVMIIIITLVSLAATTWLAVIYMNSLNDTINKQMEIYKDLSF